MSALAVGLMSGTSLDGVDAALVEIGGPHDLALLAFRTTPYEPAFRDGIARTIATGGARDLALLHVELGRRFADAAAGLLETAAVEPGRVTLVASHGQTVWHEPGRATLQLGDPAPIAERLGVPVVSDFRSRDVAAGGHGAPLVPIADVMLFGHPERGRALLNLGGMANVTWVPRRGVTEGVIAFDTGPGVAVLDAVVRALFPGRPFDMDGELAARGRPAEEIVEQLLEHPFFAAAPPRTTGRETFGEGFARDLAARVLEGGGTSEDAVATAALLTARSVGIALRRWLPTEGARDLVVSGGGARHPGLLAALRAELPGWSVRLFDELFFDGDAKEAAAFAYLGWRTRRGEPGNVPAATGARGPRVLGRMTPR